MKPPRALIDSRADDLVRIAEACGCTVVSVEPFTIPGETVRRVFVTCEDNETAVVLLNELADFFAVADSSVPGLARGFLRQAARQQVRHDDVAEYLGRELHRFVQRYVRYAPEEVETFQSPHVTLRTRIGDCDDHALVMASLAKACGIRSRVAPFRDDDGEISHVAPIFVYGGQEHVAETTLAAHYGEQPKAAARRLGLIRSDV